MTLDIRTPSERAGLLLFVVDGYATYYVASRSAAECIDVVKENAGYDIIEEEGDVPLVREPTQRELSVWRINLDECCGALGPGSLWWYFSRCTMPCVVACSEW